MDQNRKVQYPDHIYNMIILYYIIIYIYIISYFLYIIIIYYSILYFIILWYFVILSSIYYQYDHIIFYNIIFIILYYIILYIIILYYIIYYYIILYYTGWARKKFPLLKIHNTKTNSQIWVTQILVESRKIKVFLWFFSLSYQHNKYRLIQLYKNFMVAKWLKNGLKHWSMHKWLLAQNNEGNAISHGW